MPDIRKRRKAVIDIGTNSIKLCISEDSNTPLGHMVIHEEYCVTRLGEGLSESSLIEALPSDRSKKTIERLVSTAREYGASEIRAIGTAALRKAANAVLFCSKIKEACGIDVEIISGEREAALSFKAAILAARGQDCIIFDVGGGSIEFIYSQKDEICNTLSLNFGVLNIKEKYFFHEPIEDISLRQACIAITNNLHKGGLSLPSFKFLLIGAGGAVTTMASVKQKLPEFLPSKISKTILNISDIESQISQYRNSTPEERTKIKGLHADRADIILAGACIIKAIMESLSSIEIIVSTNGLRHAVLAEMFRQ